jgi:A/G-specific adenine glycosylase
MELGAIVCLPRDPNCPVCPVRKTCFARANAAVERLPAATPRKRSETVRVGVAVIRRGGKVLLERPDEKNPFRGSWDLPAVELEGSSVAANELVRRLEKRHRVTVAIGTCLGRVTHGILHRRLKLEAHSGKMRRGRVSGAEELIWVALDSLGDIPVSGATRKVLKLAI